MRSEFLFSSMFCSMNSSMLDKGNFENFIAMTQGKRYTFEVIPFEEISMIFRSPLSFVNN